MYGVPERKLRDCRDSSYFLQFARNVTSQGGEDGIFEELFRLIGTTSLPFCVDIGAWDGKHLSNTYSLVHERRWGGLLVEANSERLSAMRELYADRNDVVCLDCLVDIEGDKSLLSILNEHNVPRDLDFLSIDVDGADYHLWDTVGKQFQARVVCIEFNPTIPNHIHFVQSRDITVQEGSSLLALVELGRSFGYHVVVTTTFNAIFVREDLLHLLPPGIFTYLPGEDNKIKAWTMIKVPMHASIHRRVDLNSLHNCAMATDIFQTYSGELKLCGPKKLLWHRIPMNIQQMQVIKPKKDRVFPFAPPYQSTISTLDITLKAITSVLASIVNKETVEADVEVNATILHKSLQKLTTECTSILPLSQGRSTDAVGKKPLLSIVEEVLLNAIMMALIAHRHLTVNSSITSMCSYSEVKKVIITFIFESIQLCESVGSGYLHRSGNVGKEGMEAMVSEARVWLLRALYLVNHMNHLSSCSDQKLKGSSLRDTLQRLTLKLSTSNLLSCRNVSFGIGNANSSSSRTPSENSQCVNSVEELDLALQGLYWLQNAETQNSCDDKVGYTTNEAVSDHLVKLQVKWSKKLFWQKISSESVKISNLSDCSQSDETVVDVAYKLSGSALPMIGLSFLIGSAVTAVVLSTLRNK